MVMVVEKIAMVATIVVTIAVGVERVLAPVL